jgi:18S rRNA (guanine1575-N7)-methyltransferase
MASKRPE